MVNAHITPVDSARNLGVWFDTHLNFERHISDVCKKLILSFIQYKTYSKTFDSGKR